MADHTTTTEDATTKKTTTVNESLSTKMVGAAYQGVHPITTVGSMVAV